MNIPSHGEFSGAELVGVASTFYKDPNEVRFELALENAERWRDHNLPLVIVDGSPIDDSGDWVAKALAERSATVVRSEVNGIATQRQQGVAFAIDQGAEKVVGHEPEKIEMSRFSSEISKALDEHAVLVIGRTAAAELSLPSVQRRTERLAGWTLEQTHDLPADALSDGRGFTREGAAVLAEYPGTAEGFNNWIYLYTTPLGARSKGLSVGGLKIDLMHPPVMTADEEGDPVYDRKRYDQLKLQLDYLLSRDVDPSKSHIAHAVIAALAGLNKETPNAEFEQQLDRLEARLALFGYEA